jgi:hypothetical protein
VRIDALGNEEFKSTVARFSEMELPTNRTMRAEVDLPNPTGRLREGMYGPVSILLEPPTDFLTIPSKALHKVESGAGAVYVVEDDEATGPRPRRSRPGDRRHPAPPPDRRNELLPRFSLASCVLVSPPLRASPPHGRPPERGEDQGLRVCEEIGDHKNGIDTS